MIDQAAVSCLAFAEISQNAIFSFDIKLGRLIYCNPSFREQVQFKGELIPNAYINLLIHPEDASYVKECFTALLEGEDEKTVKFRLVLPDQTIKIVQISAFNTFTTENRQVITGTLEDKTAAKEHDPTSHSDKKSSILNIISHDLLSPLGTIQNLAELINKKFTASGNEELGRLVNSIERISRHSIALIRDLLAWEFTETAGVELILQKKNIVTTLGDNINHLRQSEVKLKKTFTFLTPKDTIMVNIDEPKFLQVVDNLISNSIKFTRENGIIEVSIKEIDKAVLLIFSDNGIGIPQKHHATLFEKFTSARRSGLNGEASNGLGMSIVKTIIEWHHGEIWFESKEHVGTTFYIKLPIN